MAVNKYAGNCASCGNRVPAKGGNLVREGRKWLVFHLACRDAGAPQVNSITTSGGTFYRNVRGRCEDAPCCGCCTI